ncbi:hypothetical protein [Paragemmobacter aquarius]|nr:hypothetical protein [Gemmobacter aquarius]
MSPYSQRTRAHSPTADEIDQLWPNEAMHMQTATFRPCRPDDLPACLVVFDSSMRVAFAFEEREEFQGHLEALEATLDSYIVLTECGRSSPAAG